MRYDPEEHAKALAKYKRGLADAKALYRLDMRIAVTCHGPFAVATRDAMLRAWDVYENKLKQLSRHFQAGLDHAAAVAALRTQTRKGYDHAV